MTLAMKLHILNSERAVMMQKSCSERFRVMKVAVCIPNNTQLKQQRLTTEVPYNIKSKGHKHNTLSKQSKKH